MRKKGKGGEAERVFLAEGMFSRSSKLAVSTPAIYPFFSRRGFHPPQRGDKVKERNIDARSSDPPK
ncbi:uncharacterized protein LOC105433019 isoform X4 [Pogonomyrmex barbatus]|uniref:Uncharacterized protein LOC105433019 isoform X4 n=1 Tax=Pogonomyrmex barbatus TaxID=144034 RepID=A0A6I9XKN4_9HYME|nr:uncharacterized protein LOC105433019 isoform X4 [Pogonomyrmex barbatus]